MIACGHMGKVSRAWGLVGPPPEADGCQDCLEAGTDWVTLRRCLSCGHIGCCDSSVMKHASSHAADSGHPLVQSFEPGEDWVWCYVHEELLEPADAVGSPSHR